MISLNEAQKQMILSELKKPNSNISRVAHQYGLDYAELKSFVLRHHAANVVVLPTRAADPSCLGREELREHIISYKLVDAAWPAADFDKINKARMQYDAGTHEMCQGRDGGTLILYLIPRKHPTQPRVYFSSNRDIMP